jgi:hypothetical protein
MIAEQSPLKHLPQDLSRNQVLIFDGIRYAASMAGIAYNRLFSDLQRIGKSMADATPNNIASAFLDIWSIIDAAHRFADLVGLAPGVRNGPWKRLLIRNLFDIAELRNAVQHQHGEIPTLADRGGSVWGYITWADIEQGKYTGHWFVMVPGTVFAGDRFTVGPWKEPAGAPLGRMRLTAFGNRVYLGKTIAAMTAAVTALEQELTSGRVVLRGSSAANERRDVDHIVQLGMQIAISREPTRERKDAASPSTDENA